ncbi:hypothetical protein ACFYY2_07600 [Streptomyces sp. NPDC001822]|uniref:hypothetical protein n=1 Tax=Streptomyces sp. NPDC001822 TaxID=3364614 RepID=UPI0036C9DF5F
MIALPPGPKHLSEYIDLTPEKERIEKDMQHAVTLEFGAYLGYLGAYGETLARMSAEYSAPEIARKILTAYADEALDRANDN